MSRKFKILFTSIIFSGFLFGFSIGDYFNVYSMMKCPKLATEQTKIVELVENHLGSDFVFYPIIVNDMYCSIADCKFKKGDEEKSYKLIVCKSENSPKQLQILMLKKGSLDDWRVIDQIAVDCSELLKVYIRDTKDDIEMVLCKKSAENESSCLIETYNYQ